MNKLYLSNSKLIGSFFLTILIAIITLSPLPFGSNRPVSWFLLSFISSGLLSVFILCSKYDIIKTKPNPKLISVVTSLFLAFCLWSFLQTIISIPGSQNHELWSIYENTFNEKINHTISLNLFNTYESIIKIFGYFALFIISFKVSQASSRAKIIIKTIIISGFLYAIYGLFSEFNDPNRILFFKKTTYVGSVTSTFINKNSFATYGALIFNITLIYFINDLFNGIKDKPDNLKAFLFKKIIEKNAFNLFILFSTFIAVIETNSRAGVFAMLAGSLSAAVMLYHKIIRHYAPINKKTLYFLLIFIICFVIIIFNGSLLERFLKLDKDLSLRFSIYLSSLGAIKDFFFLGSGLGTFEEIFNLYQSEQISKVGSFRIETAHNTYIELFLESGIVGFSIMLSIFGLIIEKLFNGYNVRKKFTYSAIGISSSLVVWSHALFDFSIEIPAIASIYSILIGTCLAQSYSKREKIITIHNQNYKKLEFITIFLISVLVTYQAYNNLVLSIQRLPAEKYVNSLYENKLDIDELDFIIDNKIDKIGYANSNSNDFYLLGLGKLQKYYKTDKPYENKKPLLQDSFKYIKKSLELSPLQGWHWYRLAYISDVLGHDKADVFKYLFNSIYCDKYGRDIVMYRLEFAMHYWEYFNKQEQEILFDQVRIASFFSVAHTKRILKKRKSLMPQDIQDILSGKRDPKLKNK